MKFLKKMMQAGLAVFFFALLATSTVLADDSEGWQFVQENGRTYYKKGEIKETAWRVIDGKYYYFDHVSGEMVVGWQYIPMPSKGSTIGPYPNGIRLEYMPMSRWYYFNQDGVLQEFVGKQVLEAKTDTNIDKYHGEQYDSPAEKRVYYFEGQRSYHTLKTGWVYDDGQWYYLQKNGGFESRINSLKVGELTRGWINDDSTWYYLDPTTGIMQTGWKYLGNKWYYLRSSGAMATGWYQDGSTWYYLDAQNGDMKTGWAYVGNKWYYLRLSGAMTTGWYQEGSTWYYLDAENGDMKTGWQYIGNKWYYLRSSGAMATGWVKDGSTWYYLHASNGDMKTGWFQVNGKWYYAYSSGALAVSTRVDGYYVNYNGEWVQ